MTFCAELIFLYNFITDYTVLYAASVIWHARGRPLILSIAANILYLIWSNFFGLAPALTYFLLFVSLLSGFKHKNFYCFLGMVFTVWACNFFIGSITLGLMAVFDAPPLIVILPCALFLFTVKRADKSVKLSRISGIYRIRLTNSDACIELNALADTGNGLYINRKPVIVADKDALLPLTEKNTATFKTTCATVGGESELTCFYTDMTFCGKTIKNVCTAISLTPINGTFNAVVNPDLLITDNF